MGSNPAAPTNSRDISAAANCRYQSPKLQGRPKGTAATPEMPITQRNSPKGCVEFRDSLTAREIDSLISDSNLSALQTSGPVELSTWKLVNDELLAVRPDIAVRLYGFYSSECDLSFLTGMTNLRRFAASSIMRATAVECVAELPGLESLSIGIYNLEGFGFLSSLQGRAMRRLSLGATKSKKPTLEPIVGFPALLQLYIEGHANGICSISTLRDLEDLTLRSVTVDDLGFIDGLKRLWSLDIKLGGTKNLGTLAGQDTLKYLELWQIRGLKDISVISTMRGLQYLFLQSLPQVSAIPNLSKLTVLRRIYLENMKGLRDLRSLTGAPALEDLIHVSATGMSPEDYDGVLANRALRQISVGFGSKSKNDRFASRALQAGVQPHSGIKQFVFV